MAKKKKNQEQEDKFISIFPAIYKELDWPIGWEKGDNLELMPDLAGHLSVEVIKDSILHETTNSFKGVADKYLAFLFLDTATGELVIWDDDTTPKIIPAVKGTLIVVKGYQYAFSSTNSVKRRVLELVF